MFSVFYNISQLNFSFLLILGFSFELWCRILFFIPESKSAFQLSVFHTYVYARKSLNPFKCYQSNNQKNKSAEFSFLHDLICVCRDNQNLCKIYKDLDFSLRTRAYKTRNWKAALNILLRIMNLVKL